MEILNEQELLNQMNWHNDKCYNIYNLLGYVHYLAQKNNNSKQPINKYEEIEKYLTNIILYGAYDEINMQLFKEPYTYSHNCPDFVKEFLEKHYVIPLKEKQIDDEALSKSKTKILTNK